MITVILKKKKVIIIEKKKDIKKDIREVIRIPVIKAIIIKGTRVAKVIRKIMLLITLEITWYVYRIITL